MPKVKPSAYLEKLGSQKVEKQAPPEALTTNLDGYISTTIRFPRKTHYVLLRYATENRLSMNAVLLKATHLLFEKDGVDIK